MRLGVLPWVPLGLALTFGLYGLLRKRAGIDALGGLLAETTLLAPVALAYLIWREAAGSARLRHSLGTSALLVAAGPITALPLVWFAVGVRHLKLATMGLIQYFTPTCQFLLAVALYREPFGSAHALAFALIWASLALYSLGHPRAVASGRRGRRGVRAAAGSPAECPGRRAVPAVEPSPSAELTLQDATSSPRFPA